MKDLLTYEFPNEIYFFGQDQLHITITAIIRDITYGDQTHSKFLSQKDIIISGISKIARKYSRFSIHFNEAEATQDALIIKSPDSDILNSLRTEIIDELSIIYPPAMIAHSSIARFKEEIPLDSLKKLLGAIEIDFIEHVEELVLVRETVMPLEKYEVVARFSLHS